MNEALDPGEARVRLALDLSPIVEVGRSLGLRLNVVFDAECRCGGVVELHPYLGRFRCSKCQRKGDALELVRLMKGMSQEEALRFLEGRAGLLEKGKAGA